MSNPFTKFLKQWSNNADFAEFIVYWDQLEAVVVGTHRYKLTIIETAAKYEVVWPWLHVHYPDWELALRPYWQQTLVGGETAVQDPFKYLLAIKNPSDILDDWSAMQQLPAAREALNQYLLDHS